MRKIFLLLAPATTQAERLSFSQTSRCSPNQLCLPTCRCLFLLLPVVLLSLLISMAMCLCRPRRILSTAQPSRFKPARKPSFILHCSLFNTCVLDADVSRSSARTLQPPLRRHLKTARALCRRSQTSPCRTALALSKRLRSFMCPLDSHSEHSTQPHDRRVYSSVLCRPPTAATVSLRLVVIVLIVALAVAYVKLLCAEIFNPCSNKVVRVASLTVAH